MGLISFNRKLLEALTLFYLSIYSSLGVYGSHLSFDESQCQNQIANDTFSVQCSKNSTILFEMITDNFLQQISINCHEENPFYSKFLPKLNILESTSYNVSLSSCKFPAHEHLQHILKNKLGILEIGSIDFNNEFIDYFPTSVNLKGLDNIEGLSFKFKNLSTIPKNFFVDLKMLKFLKISSRTSSQLPAVFDSLENIKWLHIIDSNFQYIPEKIFKHMRKMEHLILSRNNLTTITKGAWEELENLSKLDLSFNNIQTLQPDVFSNLTNLLEIDLSGNKFTSLPKDHYNKNEMLSSTKLGKNQVELKQLPENLLHNLLKLQVVKINNCQLEYISSKFFENLRELDSIDISGNNLSELPLGLFDHQVKLTSFILSNNKIQTLSDGLFKNTRKLKNLDLSNNQLKFLSNDIFKPLTRLDSLNLAHNLLGTSFNHNHLQSRSPFDHLRNPVLTNNSFNKLFTTTFDSNSELNSMQLSYNNIESVNCDYLEYLIYTNFTGNPLHCDCKIRCLYKLLTDSWSRYKKTFICQTPQFLKGRALTGLKSTELICYLETNQTSFLKPYSNECLYGILDSYLIMHCSSGSSGNLTKMPVLPELDPSFSKGIKLFIQGNQISELSPNTLQDYQNISEFGISNRLISKLPEGYFSNLLKLERVHIDLQLLDIPSDLFADSTAIEEIEITGMNLESFPKAIFNSQAGLITLNLQRNGLKKLEEYGFSSNIYLKTLDLSHNSLESLTELMFYQLRNLKSLFLGNNRLHDVSPSAFIYTNSLSKIVMENNRITTFEPFTRLKRLERVNLSSNKISSIEFSDFVDNQLRVLRWFNFTKNEIQTVKVNKNVTYTILDFGYNPFNCDCNIIPFVKFVRKAYGKKDLKKLQCMTPTELKDKFLSELQLNDVCKIRKCPKGCQCWGQPYDSILIVNCSNANLTEVPELSELELAPLNQIELSIEFNQLKRLNLNPESRCQHVTKIYAAHNMIDYISTSDIPRNLSYLDLSYNHLERLDTEVINKLNDSQNLHFIRLGHNPWKCDCSSEKLKQFILFNKARILDLNETFCTDRQCFENLSFVDMFNVKTDHTVTVISTALGIVILSICLLTILFFKNKERVLAWMYAQGICLWWVREEDHQF